MSNITRPEHYKSKIEPIDFIVANNLNFIEGNIIKYIVRYKNKNGLEDLLKGFEYYKRLIELVKNEKNEVIDNNKETTTYNITDESDIIGNIYDYEHDFSVWVVKVSKEKVFAFSDKQRSRKIIVKILEKQEKLCSKNIFTPETIKVFYSIDRMSFIINDNGRFWKFKTTDGIININYNYEN